MELEQYLFEFLTETGKLVGKQHRFRLQTVEMLLLLQRGRAYFPSGRKLSPRKATLSGVG
jgi:hypothetical protein